MNYYIPALKRAKFLSRVFRDLHSRNNPFVFSSEPGDVCYRSGYDYPMDAFDGDCDEDFLDFCEDFRSQTADVELESGVEEPYFTVDDLD